MLLAQHFFPQLKYIDLDLFSGAEASGIHGIIWLKQEWKQIIGDFAMLQQRDEALTRGRIGLTIPPWVRRRSISSPFNVE